MRNDIDIRGIFALAFVAFALIAGLIAVAQSSLYAAGVMILLLVAALIVSRVPAP